MEAYTSITPTSNSTDDNTKGNRSQTPKTITRRRGACKRCRARKVRCDGKALCSECQRLGYECQYFERKQSSVSKSMPLSPTASQQDASSENDRLLSPATTDGVSTFPPPGSDHSGNASTLGFPLNTQSQVMISHTTQKSHWPVTDANFPLDSNNGDYPLAYTEFFTDLDLDMPVGMYDHQDLRAITSPHIFTNTVVLPTESNVHTGRNAQGLLLQDTNSSLSSTHNPGKTEDLVPSPVICSSHNIFAERAQQSEFIRDALLEDIQQYCTSQHTQHAQELQSAFSKLLSERFRTCPASNPQIDLEDTPQVHGEFAFDCIKASLRDPLGISLFIDQASLEHAMREMLDSPASCSSRNVLAHSVLALGTFILRLEGACKIPEGMGYNPDLQFAMALKLKPQLGSQGFYLRDFQALVTMAYYAISTGMREAHSLLLDCVHYIQVLQLSKSKTIEKLCEIRADQKQTKSTIWFLLSLEKTFSLQAELVPSLNEDLVDFGHSQNEDSSGKIGWMSIYCSYASLCSSILQQFCSQKALKAQNSRPLLELSHHLQDWVQSLPSDIQTIMNCEQIIDLNLLGWQERRTRLQLYSQYIRAFLSIQHRIIQSEMDGTDLRSLALEQKALSVKSILQLSCQLTAADVRGNPDLYRLVCIASCDLAAATFRGPGDRKYLSYLATAAGFFGRMGLADIEVPLEEISEIVREAQGSIKEKQHQRRGSEGVWSAGGHTTGS